MIHISATADFIFLSISGCRESSPFSGQKHFKISIRPFEISKSNETMGRQARNMFIYGLQQKK